MHFLVSDLICADLSKQGRRSSSMWHWNRNHMSIYCVIYLSVAGFTINSFFLKSPFYIKKKVIIGSSDFHNYDSYTVEMTKAASAKRSVHVDQQLVHNSEAPTHPLFLLSTDTELGSEQCQLTYHTWWYLPLDSLPVPVLWCMYTSHLDGIIGSSDFHNVKNRR